MNRALIVLFLVVLALLTRPTYSVAHVVIEFVYWYPQDCPECFEQVIGDYLAKNLSLNNIQADYGSKITINRVDFYSDEGNELRTLYGVDPNSLIIKDGQGAVTVLEGEYNATYNETFVRAIIDMYLVEPPPPEKGILECRAYSGSDEISADISVIENGYTNKTPFADQFDLGTYTVSATWNGSVKTQMANITNGTRTAIAFHYEAPSQDPNVLIASFAYAFALGFFESFSPCLIALLSFVLSYSIGEETNFREGMSRVMAFAVGFISAAFLLVLAVKFLFLQISDLGFVSWAVIIFGVFFGIYMLITNFVQVFRTSIDKKTVLRTLSRKYAFTFLGLVLLGFVFYFLDPCLSPFLVITVKIPDVPEYFTALVIVFCIGVLVPFIGIGILAGSISKLVRTTYRHKTLIRSISGVVILAYSLYLAYNMLL